MSWNLNHRVNRFLDQLDLLVELVEGMPSVLALQEVSVGSARLLSERFSQDQTAVSLQLRAPRKYEGGNRRLGCALICGGGLSLSDTRLVPEVPLPERSVVAEIRGAGERFLAGSFHSLTGAGFGSAKPLMFQALTRFLEERSEPVVFGIDRNAPKVDRFPLTESQWWWPKENEEPLIFGPNAPHGCRDVFLSYLYEHPEVLAQVQAERPDGPLAVTHYRGAGKAGPSRYDAVYASRHWQVADVRHSFDSQTGQLSDHGIVVADLVLSPPDTA